MPDNSQARENAEAILKNIKELIKKKRTDQLYDLPLEISIRSDWHRPGEDGEDGEYLILLTTGGPACKIQGILEDSIPITADLYYQDWFTPWEPLFINATEVEKLLIFARLFYYGG
jgi:hypothetical protein